MLTRKQSAGCFAIAALGLAAAALCVVLGWRCTQTTTTFNCLGLLTVFPAAFAGVAILALAIGWHRFVHTEPLAAVRPRVSFGVVRQEVVRPRQSDFIQLPGRSTADDEKDEGGSG